MDAAPRGITPASEADNERHSIRGAQRHDAPIKLVEYDPRWPQLFEREAERIRQILGSMALSIEHVGSTSVAGLAAKPIIDMVLEVPDSADEANYVPPLEAAGYVLRIREPDWWQHRMLKGPDTEINLHVFTVACPEVARMLQFRDHLRRHAGDRKLYEAEKCKLAAREWAYIQNYADAKTGVIAGIIVRATESGEQS